MLVRERRHAGDESIAALIVFRGKQREIGGEALAQPGVVPVLLGHRIAEPLVRDLVRDQTRRRAGS